MTRPNITPWPSFSPKAFQPTEAQKQAIAAVPALLEALEQIANDQEMGFIARAALTAAGYQF